jgi:quercetin dioxygenase-like cupin family protein
MSGSEAIIRKSDIAARSDVAGHGKMSIYRFARPGTNSRWLHVTLNEIEEGGGIEPHYHEGVEFDHAYYVLEGEVIARVGDHEERIGPDSLMLFPCQEVHGFRVVSPGGAKILRLGASADGVASGGNVYLK